MDAATDVLNTPEEQAGAARELQKSRTQHVRAQQFEALKTGQLRGPGSTAQSDRPIADQFGRGNLLQRGSRLAALRRARGNLADIGQTAATTLAAQAQKRTWWAAHEALEDASLGFFGLGSIVLGLPTIGLYFIRAVGGNVLGGLNNSERSGSLPLIPEMDIVEFPYRTGKVIFVTVVTSIFWAAILLILFFVTNPKEIVNAFGAQAAAGFFWEAVQWFGLGNLAGSQ